MRRYINFNTTDYQQLKKCDIIHAFVLLDEYVIMEFEYKGIGYMSSIPYTEIAQYMIDKALNYNEGNE